MTIINCYRGWDINAESIRASTFRLTLQVLMHWCKIWTDRKEAPSFLSGLSETPSDCGCSALFWSVGGAVVSRSSSHSSHRVFMCTSCCDCFHFTLLNYLNDWCQCANILYHTVTLNKFMLVAVTKDQFICGGRFKVLHISSRGVFLCLCPSVSCRCRKNECEECVTWFYNRCRFHFSWLNWHYK